MDRDIDTLTVLLMDPFLTRDEAEREAAAVRNEADPTGPDGTRIARAEYPEFVPDKAK
jgi:hypothetical protein